MLNPKEALQAVKVALGMEVALETMKLENGTVLEADTFEAGKDVFIISEDDKVALPVGEYTLEGGMVLVVSEEGIIGEIKDAEEAEESTEEPTEEVTEDLEEETQEEETEEAPAQFVSVDEFERVVSMLLEEIAALKPVEEELAEEVEETTEEENKQELSADDVAEEKTELHVHNPENTSKTNLVKKAPNNKRAAIYKILNK
jgi:hypothetical protein